MEKLSDEQYKGSSR